MALLCDKMPRTFKHRNNHRFRTKRVCDLISEVATVIYIGFNRGHYALKFNEHLIYAPNEAINYEIHNYDFVTFSANRITEKEQSELKRLGHLSLAYEFKAIRVDLIRRAEILHGDGIMQDNVRDKYGFVMMRMEQGIDTVFSTTTVEHIYCSRSSVWPKTNDLAKILPEGSRVRFVAVEQLCKNGSRWKAIIVTLYKYTISACEREKGRIEYFGTGSPTPTNGSIAGDSVGSDLLPAPPPSSNIWQRRAYEAEKKWEEEELARQKELNMTQEDIIHKMAKLSIIESINVRQSELLTLIKINRGLGARVKGSEARELEKEGPARLEEEKLHQEAVTNEPDGPSTELMLRCVHNRVICINRGVHFGKSIMPGHPMVSDGRTSLPGYNELPDTPFNLSHPVCPRGCRHI